MPGFTELILLFIIILAVFGAGKLPQLGEAVGRAVKNFNRARRQRDEIEVKPMAPGHELDEKKDPDRDRR